jgi:hypothetical protein
LHNRYNQQQQRIRLQAIKEIHNSFQGKLINPYNISPLLPHQHHVSSTLPHQRRISSMSASEATSTAMSSVPTTSATMSLMSATVSAMLAIFSTSACKSSNLPRQHLCHISDINFQRPPNNLVSESLSFLFVEFYFFIVLHLLFKVVINITFVPGKKFIK